MTLLDFGPIYTTTGTITQISYAQKSADAGNTVLALKNKHCAIVLVEKPKISALYNSASDVRIKRASENVYMTYSGMENDAFFIYKSLKSSCIQYKNSFAAEAGLETVKRIVSNQVHDFTKYYGCRVIGANFITVIRDNDMLGILMTDCSGLSKFYKATCIGKGTRVVKTELEKLDFEDMDVDQMIDNGVRILYRAFDPLKDKDFDIEGILLMNDGSRTIKRLTTDDLTEYVRKYQHVSVDDD